MHESLMRQAIELARAKMREGQGGPFGALVVRQDEIVGRGWNRVTSAADPTAHAEIGAIREACRCLGTFRLDDCDLYSSSEPCPMCLGAIYWARIHRVFFGATCQDAAAAGFDDQWIYDELTRPALQRRVRFVQVLPREAAAVFADWRANPDKIPY